MSETLSPSLGKISGKLLKDNLLRDGIDLSFRNNPNDDDLLYLDVVNQRVGVNTEAPLYDLDVNGTTNAFGQLTVSGTSALIDNLLINLDGSITSSVGPIVIEPSGPDAYIFYEKVLNPDLEIDDNYIKVTTPDQRLILDPAGTGIVDLLSNTTVNGDLDVTNNINVVGNISLGGEIIIGDSPSDIIVVAPDFKQSIIPGDNLLYNLGSSSKHWENSFVANASDVENFNVSVLKISDQIQFTGQTISSLQSNDDIVITSDSGTIQLENIAITSGTINNLNNTPLTMLSTGSGYYKFTDTNAMVVPVGAFGTEPNRPGVAVGETRWNTDLDYLECFDGHVWQVSTGGGKVITAPLMEELGHVYTLIFG